eukprot:scaffold982_cov169-Amphora_coffeaeformis.AAC.16
MKSKRGNWYSQHQFFALIVSLSLVEEVWYGMVWYDGVQYGMVLYFYYHSSRSSSAFSVVHCQLGEK